MKIHRYFLKIKSGFYYFVLLAIGATQFLFFSSCVPGQKNDKKSGTDSITKALQIKDSIAKADSIAAVIKAKNTADSLKKADSIAAIKTKKTVKKKPVNPFIPPVMPAVDYGVMPVEHPVIRP
jgi:hypothetical protein